MNIGNIIKKIIEYLAKYLDEKITSFSNILSNAPPENGLCVKIYLGICIFIIYFVCIFIFLQSLVIGSIYLYQITTLNFRINSSLNQNPSSAQIDNFIYITKWFCFERNMLISTVFIILYFIALFYLYTRVSSVNLLREWSYLIMFISICFILILLYFIMFYKTINTVANKSNIMLNIIYTNLNKDYLANAPICNYFHNPTNPEYTDPDFEYGKCNGFNTLITEEKLKDYIDSQIYEISKYISVSDPQIEKDFFKNVLDDKGISYYNKILSAIITHAMVSYYKTLDPNGKDGKDFFSIYNILNTNYFEELFKYRKNPFLDLDYKNLVLLSYDPYAETKAIKLLDPDSKSVLLNYIKKDYDMVKNKITNSIIEFVNASNSITPAAYTYILIIIISVILFIIRFMQHVVF